MLELTISAILAMVTGIIVWASWSLVANWRMRKVRADLIAPGGDPKPVDDPKEDEI